MSEDVKRSQCKRILWFVDRYGSINPMQALNYLAVMRLAARISDLEKEGIHFDRKWVETVNKFGEKVRFKEYRRAA